MFSCIFSCLSSSCRAQSPNKVIILNKINRVYLYSLIKRGNINTNLPHLIFFMVLYLFFIFAYLFPLLMKKKEIIINGKRYYRTSEVCKVLGIFKNTLYNWEKKGKIPRAHRDPMSNWRLYSKQDIDRIKRISGRGGMG